MEQYKGLNLFYKENDEENARKSEDMEQDIRKLDTSIPENQGLLPPLPDFSDNSEEVSVRARKKSVTDSESSAKEIESFISGSSGVLATPKQSRSQSQSQDLNNLDFETPQLSRTRRRAETLEEMEQIYSPRIVIDEKFEVSVQLPTDENLLPLSIEEQIKFYENFQQREKEEFDIAIRNLEKGGWVNTKDLNALIKKKESHFSKWNSKIKELKRKLAGVPQELSTNSSKMEPNSRQLSDSTVQSSESENLKSPNLSRLEQQFSVLGFH